MKLQVYYSPTCYNYSLISLQVHSLVLRPSVHFLTEGLGMRLTGTIPACFYAIVASGNKLNRLC